MKFARGDGIIYQLVIPTWLKATPNLYLSFSPKYNFAIKRKIQAWVPSVFARANTDGMTG